MFELPKIPEMPDLEELLKEAEISIAEIKAMSDDELCKLLTGESEIDGAICSATQSVIANELLIRTIKKTSRPHWSVTPAFFLVIIGTAAACIAAYPVLFPESAVMSPLPVKEAAVLPPPVQVTAPVLPAPKAENPMPVVQSIDSSSPKPSEHSLPPQPTPQQK